MNCSIKFFYFVEKVAQHELRKQSNNILNYIFNEVSSSRDILPTNKIIRYSLKYKEQTIDLNECFYENILRTIQLLTTVNVNTGVFKNKIIHEFYNVKPDFYINSILTRIKDTAFFNCFHFNFGMLIETIRHNRFLNTLYKEMFINLLLKSWRLYKLFNYHLINYNRKKTRLYNTHDLYMNDFDEMPNKNKIYLKQNGIIYIFSIFEIIKYIQKQLLYQEYFNSRPQLIKNPYTNLPLSIIHLYKIYLKCIERCIHIPLAFSIYLKHDFERIHLVNQHTMFFHNEGMKQTYKTISKEDKEFYMNEMLTEGYFKDSINYSLLKKYYPTLKEQCEFVENEICLYLTYIYNVSNEAYNDLLHKSIINKLVKKNKLLEEKDKTKIR